MRLYLQKKYLYLLSSNNSSFFLSNVCHFLFLLCDHDLAVDSYLPLPEKRNKGDETKGDRLR